MKIAPLAVVASFALSAFATGCAANTEPADDSIADTEDALTRAQCRGARGETDAACRLTGTVERVVIAEFDPFVVGDACLTIVRSGNRRYGLVRAEDQCESTKRFEGTTTLVSFSKGAIDPVSSARRKVFKDFDGAPTYYDFTGDIREEGGDGLASFDALDAKGKVAFLYDVSDDWGSPKQGTTLAPVRIVDTFSGALKTKALAAYSEIRDRGFEGGAHGTPEVSSVARGGTTYAYQISSGGSFHGGSWGEVHVFDRQWNELTVFHWEE